LNLKDIAETAAYLVAAVGGPIAAFWALVQWRDSINQRKREHRWRQSEIGRQLINELFDADADAGAALEILDGERHHLDIRGGNTVTVSSDDISKALTITADKCDKSRQIRRVFDALFYHLERIQHMIDIGLVTHEDVLKPTQYYCQTLRPWNAVIERYLRATGYTKALALIHALQAVGQTHGVNPSLEPNPGAAATASQRS
jgi:hypothetical protein